MRFFPAPQPGDIVHCRFPQRGFPGPAPKPRPALVLAVGEIDGKPHVEVAYGTSQHTDRLHSGELLIAPADGDAHALSGLSYPTKFDLRNRKELPYSEEWFRVPPHAPHGQHHNGSRTLGCARTCAASSRASSPTCPRESARSEPRRAAPRGCLDLVRE